MSLTPEPRQTPREESPDRGATAVEYSIMVGLIAAVIVTGVTAFGTAVLALFMSVPAGL